MHVDDLKGIMVRNIGESVTLFSFIDVSGDFWVNVCCVCVAVDLVAQRGERLELLIDKTENLMDSVSSVWSFSLTLVRQYKTVTHGSIVDKNCHKNVKLGSTDLSLVSFERRHMAGYCWSKKSLKSETKKKLYRFNFMKMIYEQYFI